MYFETLKECFMKYNSAKNRFKTMRECEWDRNVIYEGK